MIMQQLFIFVEETSFGLGRGLQVAKQSHYSRSSDRVNTIWGRRITEDLFFYLYTHETHN